MKFFKHSAITNFDKWFWGRGMLKGFTDQEKKKFGELLANKGFKIRGTVTSNLRILITPSGSYMRSPSKEAEAIRVGAQIMDLNSLLINLAMK